MKSIFVTGGNGFLGKSICKFLTNKNFEVISPNSEECNLINYKNLDRFSSKKYDFIFHLAAWTQAGDFCLKYPGDQWIINQQINTNVLKWWSKDQPQSKLIFMGTSCSYSPLSNLEEHEYMEGQPIESLYTYAMTKRMLYQGARSLEKQFGLKWLCLVPSTLYGPSYHTDGRQMHFIFDLIRKILRGHHNKEEVILWGDGNQRREIVYIDDFINATDYLFEKIDNDIINIGAGNDASIRDFAKIISKYVGYNHDNIIYDTDRYVGAKSKKLSISKLAKINPEFYNNITDIEKGISIVIDWFKRTNSY